MSNAFNANAFGKLQLKGIDANVYFEFTKTMEAPRINVKNVGSANQEGVLLVEGRQNAIANSAARLTMSNKDNSNAYGSLEWHATTGSNGYFQFKSDLDMNSKGLHSVQRLKFTGTEKTIGDGNDVRMSFASRS